MRKFFLCALVTIFILSAQAQNDNKIVIGKIDSVYSNVLKEKRKIEILKKLKERQAVLG